ncbi:MAG: DedA family protein [bacterium]
MEILQNFIDLFVHLDRHLQGAIETFGVWIYVLLFVIIFCETGLVVTPILPGDSLLFAAGALAAGGSLSINLLFVLLFIAAIAGDNTNYWIGRFVGPKVFHQENARFFKKEYLDKTHAFFEKHGGKTIIIAQFIPIIRTFAPFVAGIGKMSYRWFLGYNVIGVLAWMAVFLLGGFYFGNLPAVKHNFTMVIMVIILISFLPGIIEYIRHRRKQAV